MQKYPTQERNVVNLAKAWLRAWSAPRLPGELAPVFEAEKRLKGAIERLLTIERTGKPKRVRKPKTSTQKDPS